MISLREIAFETIFIEELCPIRSNILLMDRTKVRLNWIEYNSIQLNLIKSDQIWSNPIDFNRPRIFIIIDWTQPFVSVQKF